MKRPEDHVLQAVSEWLSGLGYAMLHANFLQTVGYLVCLANQSSAQSEKMRIDQYER